MSVIELLSFLFKALLSNFAQFSLKLRYKIFGETGGPQESPNTYQSKKKLINIRRGEGGWELVQESSKRPQQRATIKAHPTTLHPPSPLRNNQHRFVRLIRIGRPQGSPLHFGYAMACLFLVNYVCYHVHSFWAFGNRYDAAGGLGDGIDAFEAAAGYEQDDMFIFRQLAIGE
jgi:hypothetical protein